MANKQTKRDFFDQMIYVLSTIFEISERDIQYHYKNGPNALPTGMTAYNIKSFDEKPILDCLDMDDAIGGWIVILEPEEKQAEDANGVPQYQIVDGVKVAKTRAPHVYIGSSSRGTLSEMRERFTGSA
jgi:hypothetical protein|tara:strand:+ start:861 stop:1244 length:384 start_codon:yes stop_codon:yes gene_type:complete